MSREHTGTMLDADVEYTRQKAEQKLAKDPQGFILMKLPTWFVVKLLDSYQEYRKAQLSLVPEGEEE